MEWISQFFTQVLTFSIYFSHSQCTNFMYWKKIDTLTEISGPWRMGLKWSKKFISLLFLHTPRFLSFNFSESRQINLRLIVWNGETRIHNITYNFTLSPRSSHDDFFEYYVTEIVIRNEIKNKNLSKQGYANFQFIICYLTYDNHFVVRKRKIWGKK